MPNPTMIENPEAHLRVSIGRGCSAQEERHKLILMRLCVRIFQTPMTIRSLPVSGGTVAAAGGVVARGTVLDDNPFATNRRPAMFFAQTKRLIRISGIGLTLSVCALAQCPVDSIVVRGRVESANHPSTVRVQLVFPKHKPGESGEVTVEDGAFRIPIEFVTAQSSIFTNLPARCGRKPNTVIITLLENGQQVDQVFLDFAKNFKLSDPSAYTIRSEVVLNATH